MSIKSPIQIRPDQAVIRWLAALLILLFSQQCLRAQDTATAPEDRIKAVYLFNFAQFVQWPAGAFPASNAPIVIAVSSESPMRAALAEAIAGETVNGHPFAMKYLSRGENIGDCHIVFLCRTEQETMAATLAELKNRPVLTVGESAGFCEQGGIIGFYRQGQKIRFEMNPQGADRAHLYISSKLLNMTRIKSTATAR